METGKVKWFSAQVGCGFITADNGGTVLFVQRKSIQTGAALKKHQKVVFQATEGPSGLQADKVRPL
ncbi:cold shock domain-containing protein [Pseudomonas sp. 15FMM2]|uniref:Cold shock domain-containing protein n=1 Tax=Pseudomonas imrae TaxID=2992837 RepID=A0ACC7PGI1_9PSED